MRAARDLLLTTLTAATVLVAVGSWGRVTLGLSHAMLPISLVALLVVGVGTGLRSLQAPRWSVPLVQLALAWIVVSIRLTHTWIPLRYAPRMRLENAFVAAGDTVLNASPPVPVIDGVLPFVLCGAALALVLADFLARTLRMPAVAGLVLLTVLAVPISIAGSDLGLTGAARAGVAAWLFALVAAGWLAQVVLGEDDRLERWGRQVGGKEQAGTSPTAGRALAGTVVVSGTATVLALVVPLAIPTMRFSLDAFGGSGTGGHISVTNPMVDVRRNLQQGADLPLVSVRTDDPNPSYLRIAVLTRFNASQWSAGDRSIPQGQDAHGQVPIAGYQPRTDPPHYRYDISVMPTFESRWLPTPAPISNIDAEGDWRYDVGTDDFLAASKGLTTAGMSYQAVRVSPDLSATGLDDLGTGIGQVAAIYTDLPHDLPKIVGDLALQVTRKASSPFERAVALQDWFRDSGNFTYSTDTVLGSSADDLATFLGTGNGGRTGYCQQFAAAMAAMARTLGIPSRVAVGFLAPTRAADDSYVFSAHDMHAWPELYFAGEGWVRFEPTPAAAGTTVPSYAHAPGAVAPAPSNAPSTGTSTAPAIQPSAKPRPGTDQGTPQAGPDIITPDRRVFPWVLGGLALVVVLAAAVIPGAVRRRRRRTRLRGSAEDAWAEMRDTVIDLGIPWADGVSPRTTRRLLDRYVGTHEGHVALDRLVEAVERERYAAVPGPLAPQTLLDVIDGLRQGTTANVVRRAAWWPRSVLRHARRVDVIAPSLDRVG